MFFSVASAFLVLLFLLSVPPCNARIEQMCDKWRDNSTYYQLQSTGDAPPGTMKQIGSMKFTLCEGFFQNLTCVLQASTADLSAIKSSVIFAVDYYRNGQLAFHGCRAVLTSNAPPVNGMARVLQSDIENRACDNSEYELRVFLNAPDDLSRVNITGMFLHTQDGADVVFNWDDSKNFGWMAYMLSLSPPGNVTFGYWYQWPTGYDANVNVTLSPASMFSNMLGYDEDPCSRSGDLITATAVTVNGVASLLWQIPVHFAEDGGSFTFTKISASNDPVTLVVFAVPTPAGSALLRWMSAHIALSIFMAALLIALIGGGIFGGIKLASWYKLRKMNYSAVAMDDAEVQENPTV